MDLSQSMPMAENSRQNDPGDLLDNYPELKGARLRWDERTGQLKQAVGLMTRESGETPEKVAGDLIERFSGLLGAGMAGVTGQVKQVGIAQNPAGDLITYQQFIGDIPVYHGIINVYISPLGQVYRLSNDFRPEAGLPAAPEAFPAGIDERTASRIAQAEVNAAGRLSGPASAEKVYYPASERLILAWQVAISLNHPVELWSVFVDARNGKVLEKTQKLLQQKD